MGLAGMGLSADRTKPIRHIVPDSGFHKGGILRRTELLESAHVRNHLRNSHTHVFKLAEPETLAVGCRDSDVGGVVEEIDLVVLERHTLGRHDQAISVEFQRYFADTEFALEELKQGPATSLALVADGEEVERLRGILHKEFHEGHDENVVALSGLVAVQVEKEEDVVGELELLSGELSRHGEIQVALETVDEDVHGTRDTLIL